MEEKTKAVAKESKKSKKAPAKKIMYTKEQILMFGKYANRVDLVGALLENGKLYTQDEVDAKLKKFMTRGTK